MCLRVASRGMHWGATPQTIYKWTCSISTIMKAPDAPNVATYGVPSEAMGLPVPMKDESDIVERVHVANVMRHAHDEQKEAERDAMKTAELDALYEMIVAELRRAPLEQLMKKQRVFVFRKSHKLYEGRRFTTSCEDLDNEINKRFQRSARRLHVRLTVHRRRRFVHRLFECDCNNNDYSPFEECCCCCFQSVVCACLPLAYWIPRWNGYYTVYDYEIEVNVHMA
jgi:hypothetical protein